MRVLQLKVIYQVGYISRLSMKYYATKIQLNFMGHNIQKKVKHCSNIFGPRCVEDGDCSNGLAGLNTFFSFARLRS